MRFDKSKQLYSYWLGLKGSRLAPARSEIEPNDIRNLLGDTFILEINHRAKYIVYRLAGTRLCAAYGRELKGLGYLVHWEEEDNIEVLNAIQNVYSSYTPTVISHHGQSEQKRFMEYETLMLPLQPIEDGTARILGICSPKKVAFWHGSEPIVTHRLRSVRSVDQRKNDDLDLNVILDPPSIQFGNEHSANKENNRVGRKVAHLTLLDGGKN